MLHGHAIIVDGYSRSLVLANPSMLFAYSDNLQGIGQVGQAALCRGCSNAVAIPTKITPTQHLFDIDVLLDKERWKYFLIIPFVKLREHLRAGGNIVWPKEGIGTDEFARLHITGPIVLQFIEEAKEKVFSEALSVMHETHKT